MNHRLLLAPALLCAASGVFGAGSVRWLETKHNFGAFHEDEGTVECTFRYVNDGDAPLSITAARTSCGCTLPHYTREPLAPGDTAYVTVSYDPTGRPGRFSKNVYINMDCTDERVSLTVSGVVIGAPTTVSQRYPVALGRDMRLSRSAVMAGDVARGRMKSVFVEVYNASTDTLRPQAVYAPGFVDVQWMPEAVAPGEQSSMVCHVRTADSPDWGLVADSLVIAPDAASGERYVLPVTVVVSEDFSKMTDEQRAKAPVVWLEPERLDCGVLDKSSGTVEMKATISNNGRTPLEIRRIYSMDEGVDVSLSTRRIKPGKRAEITVGVDPSRFHGTLINAKISIITHDPGRPNATLRVVGELRR